MEYSQLKIIVDSAANFYLDTISVSTKYSHYATQYTEYDSILGKYAFVFDSLENGYIDIKLSSFLDRIFNKQIDLRSDTFIFIDRNELINFQDIATRKIPFFNLNNGDTIVIGLNSSGCFHFLKENIVVSKNADKYHVAFNTTRMKGYGYGNMNLKKEFDLSFNKQIHSFYNSCQDFLRQRKAEAKKGLVRFSTSSAVIYFRKGNNVFRFPDFGPYDWEGYNDFIKAIDPPWPKINE